MRSSLLTTRPYNKSAFTLLELCIVIGIIAVLAVLVFGVSKQFSQKTANIRCMSNLRGVGQLIIQYAQDHNNDLIPWLTFRPPDQGSHWLYWLWATDYLPRSSYDNLRQGIMTCPARGVAGSYDSDRMHYGMNSFPGFDSMIYVGEAFHKITRIQRPSKTFLLADANNVYYLSPTLPQHFAYPHNDHANAVFFDGHVEALPRPIAPPADTETSPWY